MGKFGNPLALGARERWFKSSRGNSEARRFSGVNRCRGRISARVSLSGNPVKLTAESDTTGPDGPERRAILTVNLNRRMKNERQNRL